VTSPNAQRALRVLIVDDEQLPRQRLLRLLEEIPNTECVGECANGRSAVDAIESLLPDLVLLDVRMPGMGGLDVARALTGNGGHVPFVIFVTAFDEYALSAFEVHAIDYLLKPVERDRFVAAIERARGLVQNTTAAQRHERLLALLQGEPRASVAVEADGREALVEHPPVPAGDPGSYPRRFLVKGDGQMYFVGVDDIDWIEAYGNYVRLHVGKGVHLIRETLGNIERKLDPTRFARVHRSSIVNLDRVARMDLWGAGDYVVLLKDGTKLKLSRWYRSRIEHQAR
jgi:two-component system, LytTR family, response regulator